MSNLPRQYLDRVLAQTPNIAIWASILSVGADLGEIFVHHPARAAVAGEHAIPALLQIQPRSKTLTRSLLIVSSLSGLLAFQRTKDKNWLIGAALMILGIPYSSLLQSPIVEQLKYLTLDARSIQARTLIESWGRVQCGKLALAMGGATIFYWLTRRR